MQARGLIEASPGTQPLVDNNNNNNNSGDSIRVHVPQTHVARAVEGPVVVVVVVVEFQMCRTNMQTRVLFTLPWSSPLPNPVFQPVGSQ